MRTVHLTQVDRGGIGRVELTQVQGGADRAEMTLVDKGWYIRRQTAGRFLMR